MDKTVAFVFIMVMIGGVLLLVDSITIAVTNWWFDKGKFKWIDRKNHKNAQKYKLYHD